MFCRNHYHLAWGNTKLLGNFHLLYINYQKDIDFLQQYPLLVN
ncbi:hypothetical protein SynSYN20_00928 [Synechococcus sp. SYN20]|nr:hypothetical protein SynSYN20_00928 [Synechococcus sp. SYN20]